MKSVYSDKSNVYMCWTAIVIFTTALLYAVVYMAFNIHQNNIVVVCVILIIVFVLSLALGIIGLNRVGCTITYDSEKKILYRKGYICGYSSQISVESITEIIQVQVPKESTSYILVDPSHTKYWSFDKESFFKIKKSKENKYFIEQFWDKPIKEYKKYEDLFKQG